MNRQHSTTRPRPRGSAPARSSRTALAIMVPADNTERARALGVRIPVGKPDGDGSCCLPTPEEIREHNARVTAPDVYFGTVSGDCMYPEFHDGWLLELHTGVQPEPGDIVHVAVNGARMLKQYDVKDGQVILRTLNPEYVDFLVKPTTPFKILGVVEAIVGGMIHAEREQRRTQYEQRAQERREAQDRAEESIKPQMIHTVAAEGGR